MALNKKMGFGKLENKKIIKKEVTNLWKKRKQ